MKSRFEVIGAPFGFAGRAVGAAYGPSFLRENGLNMKIRQRTNRWGADIVDSGDVLVNEDVHRLLEQREHEKAVELYCHSLYEKVHQSYNSGRKPIVIGGDHSISIATISATASFLKNEVQSDRLGVIWVDAHADLSDWEHGNIHGKIAAALLGYSFHDSLNKIGGYSPKLSPQNLVYIGLNDLMPNEHKRIHDNNIEAYGMDKIESMGIHTIMNEVVTKLEETVDAIFLTFDIDSCDGGVYRGFAVPEAGGLTGREAVHIVHRIAQSPKFMGADLVEFSPEDDVFKNTNQLAIKLIDAIWGYRM